MFISLILLNTLNPQIIGNWVIKITPPNLIIKPGIYLCKDESVMLDSYYYNIKNYNERLRGNKQWKKAFNVWKEKIDKNCLFIINETARIDKDFGTGSVIYMINKQGKEGYGAILYAGSNFTSIRDQYQQLVLSGSSDNEDTIRVDPVALTVVKSIRPLLLTKK